MSSLPPFSSTRFLALVLFGATAANAQTRPPRVATDVLVREGRALASGGDTTAALEMLEQATDQSPRDPDALYWRSLIMVRTTQLGMSDAPRRLLAWRLLNRAADIDAKNARYLTELGRLRLRTPLMRAEAERLFRRALLVAERSGDPVQIADVAAELGHVKERRYLTGRNRWMYTGTVTFDPVEARLRPHYTREFLDQLARPIENSGAADRSEAEEMFRLALRAVPHHEPSVLGLMGLLYDQQRYEEMRTIAQPLVQQENPSARVLLASGLAEYKLGSLANAEQTFERSLQCLSAGVRREFLDIGRVLRKGDSVRVAGLTGTDRSGTLAAFWEAADPLLATPQNEAQLEYFARLAYADLRFSDTETQQQGWRTDRGLIVARYGEPPVIATFAPQLDADSRDALARVITVWFYPRTEMEFAFFGPPAINLATFAGNYRDYSEERRESGPFLLDNVVLAMEVDTIPVQMARFRGASANDVLVVVAAAVDGAAMYERADIDQGQIELALRIGPPSALQVRATDTIVTRLPISEPVLRTWSEQVPRGAQRVRVEARDASVASALARAQADLAATDFSGATLTTSDLLIATRQAPAERVLRGWRDAGILPRANLRLPARDTFAVYWETYGLTPTVDQRVRYDLHITVTLVSIDRGRDALRNFFGNLSDAVGLSPEGDTQLGVRFTRDEAIAGRDRVPDVVTLGLGSAPPGTYRLQVTITDSTNGARVSAQREFTISRMSP